MLLFTQTFPSEFVSLQSSSSTFELLDSRFEEKITCHLIYYLFLPFICV